MSLWSRTAAAALPMVALLTASTAQAQKTPKQRADELNNEGRELFGEGKLAAAADRFRQAIVMSPEGRFYFNLCYTLDRQQRYRDAIVACEAVADNGASDRLKKKTEQLMEVIRKKITAASSQPEGEQRGGQPTVPPPTPSDPYAGATPGSVNHAATNNKPATKTAAFTRGGGNGPSVSVPEPARAPGVKVRKKAVAHPYRWALGFELGGVSSTIGDEMTYGKSGALFRGHADFVLSHDRHIGIQPYFTVTQVAAGTLSEELRVLDLGLAAYKNIQIGRSRAVFTPLFGAQVALMSPEGLDRTGSSLVGVGLRAELELAYLFGSRSRNALRFVLGVNAYAGARGGGDSFDPAAYGLDAPGATSYILLGFTRRFTSKFGTRAMFTLE